MNRRAVDLFNQQQSRINSIRPASIQMTTSTYFVDYCDKTIETTVTKDAIIAQDWINKIKNLSNHNGKNSRIIGVNCKYIRHPIKSLSKRAALLQLCVGTRCLILQLSYMGDVTPLVHEFLCDSSIVFAGVQIEEISKKLSNEYGLELGARKLDLHLMAKHWFPMSYRGRPSLKALACGIAGLSMRKGNRYKGDWESSVLDDELVERACCDAYVSYCIADRMLTKNRNL